LFYLRVYDQGDNVRIEWDKNSALIRSSHLAVLDIKDGSETKRYALTDEQLQEGNLTYVRSSDDVELRMVVYPQNRAGVHQFARVVSPSRVASSSEASSSRVASASQASPVSAPVDSIRSRAERDQMENQIKQLKEELGKQVARNGHLQEVVRILENRIAVEAARSSTGDTRRTK
jgi:hypothetical protein